MNRGDVVIADFSFQDMPGSKVRPAVVVQNDADNAALANTILAMITGNLADSARPTNVLVDPSTAEGASSGLHGPSLIKCGNLAFDEHAIQRMQARNVSEDEVLDVLRHPDQTGLPTLP